MKNKSFELWSSSAFGDTFFPQNNPHAHKQLPSGARFICVIRAKSWNEAQQKRYKLLGWGRYRVMEEDAK